MTLDHDSGDMTGPDGLNVVYRADQSSDGTFELFRVPIAGLAPPALLTPMPAGGRVEADFELSADGMLLFYRAGTPAHRLWRCLTPWN